MANTVTIEPTNLRVGPAIPNVGVIPFSVAVSDTYASGSGGITIDFTAVLATIPKESRPVHADLIRAIGRTVTGYMAVFTKSASGNAFTCKLWNGLTQFVNGAITQTITGELFFAPGGQS